MRAVFEFVVVNLFLIAMGLVGLGVVMGLFLGLKWLGLSDETIYNLAIPIALAGIFSTYYAGKGAHHLLTRR